jgi:hypothetical protein
LFHKYPAPEDCRCVCFCGSFVAQEGAGSFGWWRWQGCGASDRTWTCPLNPGRLALLGTWRGIGRKIEAERDRRHCLESIRPRQNHAICKTSRGTAQTTNDWHSHLNKQINVSPSSTDEDPLFGLRSFCVFFAAGTLPIPTLGYTKLASSKLVALPNPDSNKPMSIGIMDVFHRLGMTSLLKADSRLLANYFGELGEFGNGIPGEVRHNY